MFLGEFAKFVRNFPKTTLCDGRRYLEDYSINELQRSALSKKSKTLINFLDVPTNI